MTIVTMVGTHAINDPCGVAVPSFVVLGDAGRHALGIVAVPFEGLAGAFAWRILLACSNSTSSTSFRITRTRSVRRSGQFVGEKGSPKPKLRRTKKNKATAATFAAKFFQ